jgi:hypothetical protein
MTSLYLFMFLIILFIVHFDYMLSLVGLILSLCICSCSVHPLNSWVNGRYDVSVVLRWYLPTDAPYMLGSVVDHGTDNPAESFVTHTLCIGQVEPGCWRIVLLCPGSLLGNVPYT